MITLQFVGPVVVWRYNGEIQTQYRTGTRSNREMLLALLEAYPHATVELTV